MSNKHEPINITRNADGSFTSKISGIRLFEMVQYVTGYIEGEFKDWPAQLQDPIYAALERKSDEVQLPLTIVNSGCLIDHGEAMDGSDDRFYVHVIASEVVAADERTMGDYEIKRAVEEITNRRKLH